MPDSLGANSLTSMVTPSLILDRTKLDRNIARMADHITGLGCTLRPHVKTSKCIDVIDRVFSGHTQKKICVSTLKEASQFFQAGILDILYAVSIAPQKLDQVAEIAGRGARISIILDDAAVAQVVAQRGRELGVTFRVYLEIDVDGHRTGVSPSSSDLIEIGRILHNENGVELIGVITHAGESYNKRTIAELSELSGVERSLTVAAAQRLRDAQISCGEVSIGSTPTATFAQNLSGISEVRAGVYMFHDLFQCGLGVCQLEDIAISVLGTVIGHKRRANQIIIDLGWTALSQDRGTALQDVDYGYGVVLDIHGNPIDDLIVAKVNQEHGIIGHRTHDKPIEFYRLPIGAKVRILPNHACATAAQFDHYSVLVNETIVDRWERFGGW